MNRSIGRVKIGCVASHQRIPVSGLEPETQFSIDAETGENDGGAGNSDDGKTGSLFVRVTDALGDGIGHARLSVDGGEWKSGKEGFHIQSIGYGERSIAASADGYAGATIAVNIPVDREADISLEYLCEFRVRVFSDARNPVHIPSEARPVSGAEVRVWKGHSVKRPPVESLRLRHYEERKQRHAFTALERTPDGIRVAKVETSRNDRFIPGILRKPAPGDLVWGFCGGMWKEGYASAYGSRHIAEEMFVTPSSRRTRLHVWDALTWRGGKHGAFWAVYPRFYARWRAILLAV